MCLQITDLGNKDSTPPPTLLSLANEVIDLAPSADDPVSGGTPASGGIVPVSGGTPASGGIDPDSGGTPASGGIDPVSGGTSANKYNSILHPDPGYKPGINSGDLFDT